MSDSGTGQDQPTAVLIIDDHILVAEALTAALQAQPDVLVVGHAATLGDGLKILSKEKVDVVLLDYRLPDADGVEGIRSVLAAAPAAAVVMVTATEDERVLIAAVEAGCAGFVTKTGGMTDVLDAVRRAATGEATITPSLLARLLRRLSQRGTGIGRDLTEREQEVLGAITEGLPNSEIAERLVVSVNTVRNHVQSVLAKLGAHSKLEAAAIAVREGLVQPGQRTGR
jgi:DNA-binding NarL/FixJ family response regulator